MRPYVRTLLAIVLGTMALACGEAATVGKSSAYLGTIEPLLAKRCASKCHEPGVPDSGFMDLRPGHARISVVSVPSEELPTMMRVMPGDLSTSYLWHKLKGTHLDVGGIGEPMPYASSLQPSDIALVEQWIVDGAKE